jgi:putative transposase
MFRTYKVRLYPTETQTQRLCEQLETCRRFYNFCLGQRIQAYQEDGKSLSKYDQAKQITKMRGENSYMQNICYGTLQQVIIDLDKAYRAFFRRIKSGSEKPGFPKFKKYGRYNSYTFNSYNNGVKISGRRLKLFYVGRVPARWDREIEGEIKTVRIVKENDQWYACFFCDLGQEPEAIPIKKAVGIDVGIYHLMALSDGTIIDNPGWYHEMEREIRILNRKMARQKRGGSRYTETKRKYAKLAKSISNKRDDFYKKLVADLLDKYDLIVVEDLEIENMVQNRHLSKSIMDAGWGIFTRFLEQKGVSEGKTVEFVSARYTSKTCSNCGAIFDELSLADRWVNCDCGLSMDRDINAAINILKRAKAARQDISTTNGLWLS